MRCTHVLVADVAGASLRAAERDGLSQTHLNRWARRVRLGHKPSARGLRANRLDGADGSSRGGRGGSAAGPIATGALPGRRARFEVGRGVGFRVHTLGGRRLGGRRSAPAGRSATPLARGGRLYSLALRSRTGRISFAVGLSRG